MGGLLGKNLLRRGWYAKNLENLFFQGKSCYHAADERIRLQEQKPSGIFPGQRGPQNHFKLWWPGLPHNLGANGFGLRGKP
jgi:hypothetical protein